MTKILFVEDSPSNAMMYATYLEQAGFDIKVVDQGKAALLEISQTHYDFVVLDLNLPDINGLDVLKRIPQNTRRPPTIVLTGNGSIRAAVEAMRAGAMDFLMKPCTGEKLIETVQLCLKRATMLPLQSPQANSGQKKPSSHSQDHTKIQAKFQEKPPHIPPGGPTGFFGRSPSMVNVFSLIENAASSAASVFITGESGTGKELCAQAIHKASRRSNAPFVAINCAAIPRNLMESEIFGHRKGAFTGALSDQLGCADLANGGTMFLDEICEMDLDLQAKLLRFIQTGTYKPVGDMQERQTDIRFVCATNRDPLEEIQNKNFREDLYYRLYVIPLDMPPLRARLGDIGFLAARFLDDFAQMDGKKFDGFTPDAIRQLKNYRWPGNIRELQNIVQQIVVMNPGGWVTPDMLPRQITSAEKVFNAAPDQNGGKDMLDVYRAKKPAFLGSDGVPYDIDAGKTIEQKAMETLLMRPMEELQQMAIAVAMRKYNGNVTQASRALKISPSSIYRKKKSGEFPAH